MEGLQYTQWLDVNANRRYPLAAAASAIDTTGAFALPNDFIVELYLSVGMSLTVDPTRFFLRTVTVFPGGYGIVIGYQPPTGDSVVAATGLIPKPGLVEYGSFTLGGVGDFADALGHVTIGRTDNIDLQPPGSWSFDFEAGGIDPDAIRPCLRGVTGIRVRNGSQVSDTLTGIVELVAGANTSFGVANPGTSTPSVTINHITGEGTSQECVCVGDAPARLPIYSINTVLPTADGTIYILGSACLTVEDAQNQVKLSNPCSTPCCGPVELEAITRDLQQLLQEKTGVDAFTAEMRASISAMLVNILGSKTGDGACGGC